MHTCILAIQVYTVRGSGGERQSDSDRKRNRMRGCAAETWHSQDCLLRQSRLFYLYSSLFAFLPLPPTILLTFSHHNPPCPPPCVRVLFSGIAENSSCIRTHEQYLHAYEHTCAHASARACTQLHKQDVEQHGTARKE